MQTSFDYLRRAIAFWGEMERLNAGLVSGDDRQSKIVELYLNVVKPERGTIRRKKKKGDAGQPRPRDLLDGPRGGGGRRGSMPNLPSSSSAASAAPSLLTAAMLERRNSLPGTDELRSAGGSPSPPGSPGKAGSVASMDRADSEAGRARRAR